MPCLIQWYEQNAGSRTFRNTVEVPEGKTSLSFFCRKTVLTTEEEALAGSNAGSLPRTSTPRTLCTTPATQASTWQGWSATNSLRLYNSRAGAGRTEGLLYTYEDTHCKNIVPSAFNTNAEQATTGHYLLSATYPTVRTAQRGGSGLE